MTLEHLSWLGIAAVLAIALGAPVLAGDAIVIVSQPIVLERAPTP